MSGPACAKKLKCNPPTKVALKSVCHLSLEAAMLKKMLDAVDEMIHELSEPSLEKINVIEEEIREYVSRLSVDVSARCQTWMAAIVEADKRPSKPSG